MMTKLIKSPCLGICSTVYGDEVCKGCKRFYHEVIAWNSWDNEQKMLVYSRLEALMAQAMGSKLTIMNCVPLEEQLERYGFLYQHFKSPYWWLYLLWVKKPEAISSLEALEALEVEVLQEYQALKVGVLFNQIDDELNGLANRAFEASSTER